MEIREVAVPDDHITKWSKEHADDVSALYNELVDPNVKAVVISGPIHSGKTSLAASTGRLFSEEQGPAYFTTPALQETVGAQGSVDRTGINYDRLPAPSEIAASGTPVLIVIDEISLREPTALGRWNMYFDSPNTKIVLLSHPNSLTLGKWTDLLPESNISRFEI